MATLALIFLWIYMHFTLYGTVITILPTRNMQKRNVGSIQRAILNSFLFLANNMTVQWVIHYTPHNKNRIIFQLLLLVLFVRFVLLLLLLVENIGLTSNRHPRNMKMNNVNLYIVHQFEMLFFYIIGNYLEVMYLLFIGIGVFVNRSIYYRHIKLDLPHKKAISQIYGWMASFIPPNSR